MPSSVLDRVASRHTQNIPVESSSRPLRIWVWPLGNGERCSYIFVNFAVSVVAEVLGFGTIAENCIE